MIKSRWISAGGSALMLMLGASAFGQSLTNLKTKGKTSVVIFIATDCPIANKYAPEINRIIKTYSAKGVYFCLAYVDKTAPLTTIEKHLRDYRYTADFTLDPSFSWAKKFGATTTPEAVVLSKEGKVLYRGRIDDRVADYGKIRLKPRTTDLRNALDAVLAGKPVKVPVTKAIGCVFRTP